MASCDDDFSILGDDNATQSSNPNAVQHNHLQKQTNSSQRFPVKSPPPIHLPAPVQLVVVPAAGVPNNTSPTVEGGANFSDRDLCSQLDPYTGNDSNPFEGESDPNRSRANASIEKRKDRDELSDGGTPYSSSSYKKSKLGAGGGSSSAEYRKDREEWSDTAIGCLLDSYTEKLNQLNRGNLRGRDWEEVAATVSEGCDKQIKSVEQCKNKVDNLKKRYKLERQRMTNMGLSTSHWPWFKQMDVIVGNSLPASKAVSEDDKAVAGSSISSLRQTKRYGMVTPSLTAQMTSVKKSLANPRWRRVVLKISGAALAGTSPQNIDPKVAMLIAREVSTACRLGVEVAIVVGGRNFFCGDTWVTSTGLDRCTAYQIGMMATVMNSILIQSAIEKTGIQTRVQTAFSMPEVAEPYSRQKAVRHLEKGRVVIFGGIGAGTGNPLFSTDTAAALRASEIHADAVLKGTNVDGVYVCDSGDNVVSEHISFRELASRGAYPMDVMAVTFCEENGISVVVFNLHQPGNISRALCGEQVGTLIDQAGSVR